YRHILGGSIYLKQAAPLHPVARDVPASLWLIGNAVTPDHEAGIATRHSTGVRSNLREANLAKSASKAKKRPAKAGKKSAAKKRAAPKYDPLHSEEGHLDGCLCDVKLDESMFTPDSELPPARGGVEMRRR